VRSPEQVALELPVAGPTSRILAYAIDGLLMLVLAIGVIVLLIWALPVAEWLVELLDRAADELVGDETQDPGLGGAGLLLLAIYIGIQLVVEIFYFVFFEVLWRGASPGKRALGLAVVGENGLPVSFTASLVRNLLRAVDALPVSYLTGLVTMLVSEHTRRLGDIAAGTIVIRFDRGRPVAPLEAAPVGAEHVPFTREQMQRVGATERQLLRQTLRRLDSLDAEEAERLAQRSAGALAERLGADAPEIGAAIDWLRALHTGLSRR
jgi:uncharacterized RDD family membrane protein YckC